MARTTNRQRLRRWSPRSKRLSATCRALTRPRHQPRRDSYRVGATRPAARRAGSRAVGGVAQRVVGADRRVIGLVASVTLTVEKIKTLTNPSYVPSCNLNPVVSCGSVMATPQASLLGFPNPLIGIAAFTVVVVTGVLAVTKVPLPQWYWIALAAATLAGAGFVHWLIFQSLYRIGALCPYCMVVWAVTIPLLVVVASIAFGRPRGAVSARR
ncbi:vitamin K epoxide reductase family protein [Mycobacterium xenopi 4042]|uniref:Vitamin K epoxide reductase family protein n=1 Tax=Mycobacterium xenopi 4042 TaxID=1299334 RepID=X8E8G4_MYCXE|nr:vitamin K epoxide reductase family protein [Mycobacterium xenopi 4042]